MLNAIDNVRPVDRRLSPQTVRLLAEKFSRYGQQYLIFSEFEGLNDASIARFLEVVDRLDRISNLTLRANALGIFQSDVGLWQILARQRQISPENLNDSWQRMISPFAAGTNSAPLLFDAGRASLQELSRAVSGKTNLSQDELIKLLAGPNQPHPVGHGEPAPGFPGYTAGVGPGPERNGARQGGRQ
jgi:hypothetical protein